jgi:hypothetical protein
MRSPVVVDGRTDEEKLHELIAIGAEYDELDFKATLDLGDKRKALDFAKDCISMNTTAGGYIVIGLLDDGRPAIDQAIVDARQFDSADLGQLVGKFVNVPTRIYSQRHEVDGRVVVLVAVLPTPSLLPALISHIGQYERGGGRMLTVLTPGVLYTRSGSQNVTASDGHWSQLLERYREQVVKEAREGIDALTRGFVEALGQAGTGAPLALPPLLLDADNGTFLEAFRQHLDAPSGIPLQRLLRQAVTVASFTVDGDIPARLNALDKLALAALEALQYDKREVFDRIVDSIHRVYISGGDIDTYGTPLTRPRDVKIAQFWLEVLLRVYLVGAAAVRENQWWAVSGLVRRPVDIGSRDPFATWLRHGLVYASRANLLSGQNEQGGLILSMARELGQSDVAFRQDIPVVPSLGLGESPTQTDTLLDSLAQFDVAYCIVMATTQPEKEEFGFYPSCAALRQDRAQPAIRSIASSEDVRRALVPGSDNIEFANAIKQVFRWAVAESRKYRSFWPGIDHDPQVASFVEANISA